MIAYTARTRFKLALWQMSRRFSNITSAFHGVRESAGVAQAMQLRLNRSNWRFSATQKSEQYLYAIAFDHIFDDSLKGLLFSSASFLFAF